jgi:hypothetical protein
LYGDLAVPRVGVPALMVIAVLATDEFIEDEGSHRRRRPHFEAAI